MDTIISKILKAGLLLAILLGSSGIYAQTEIPDIELSDMDGDSYQLSDLVSGEKITVVIFWATWCKPCIDELDNIADYYDEWLNEIEFNLVSVCIDDSRTSSSVKGFVRGRDWPFWILMDENQDLKRTMNVTDIPYYCIFDKKGKIVLRHTGYIPGDEEIMFEEIARLNNEN
jgi:cytochrome c biogenesis protein CcmG/thiol:disulfide interchange protein DsbE